jgi:3-oxoacyl-[acyl-carrier protein] reductase
MNARPSSTHDLAGSVVVVTGGSRGIGAATARAIAERGARVIVSGRDAAAIDSEVAAICWDGGTAHGVVADCTDAAAIARLRAETEAAFGPADILLAFAGGGGEPSASDQLTSERWCAVLTGNLTATFLTIREFLPGMAERGRGSVVTMASAAARQPSRSNVAYAAAKAGVIQLTRHLASEYAVRGIRLNCIAPAAIENERMNSAMTRDEINALGQSFPLRRIGKPEDVASAAIYLATDQSSWVTGVVLDVAGGRVMV